MKATRIFPFALLLMIPVAAYFQPEIAFGIRQFNKCPISIMDLELKPRSRGQCSGACLQQFHCLGFCHNDATQICLITNSNYTRASAEAVVAPGFNMYWPDGLDNYHRYGHKAYTVITTAVNFAMAEAGCRQKNVSLSFPMSHTESKNIVDATSKYGIWNSWINGKDSATEGTWINLRTGQPATFLEWFINEPNGGTRENCLYLIGTTTMCDSPCSNNDIYTCETFVYGHY